jgi:hypothetical protein
VLVAKPAATIRHAAPYPLPLLSLLLSLLLSKGLRVEIAAAVSALNCLGTSHAETLRKPPSKQQPSFFAPKLILRRATRPFFFATDAPVYTTVLLRDVTSNTLVCTEMHSSKRTVASGKRVSIRGRSFIFWGKKRKKKRPHLKKRSRRVADSSIKLTLITNARCPAPSPNERGELDTSLEEGEMRVTPPETKKSKKSEEEREEMEERARKGVKWTQRPEVEQKKKSSRVGRLYRLRRPALAPAGDPTAAALDSPLGTDYTVVYLQPYRRRGCRWRCARSCSAMCDGSPARLGLFNPAVAVQVATFESKFETSFSLDRFKG